MWLAAARGHGRFCRGLLGDLAAHRRVDGAAESPAGPRAPDSRNPGATLAAPPARLGRRAPRPSSSSTSAAGRRAARLRARLRPRGPAARVHRGRRLGGGVRSGARDARRARVTKERAGGHHRKARGGARAELGRLGRGAAAGRDRGRGVDHIRRRSRRRPGGSRRVAAHPAGPVVALRPARRAGAGRTTRARKAHFRRSAPVCPVREITWAPTSSTPRRLHGIRDADGVSIPRHRRRCCPRARRPNGVEAHEGPRNISARSPMSKLYAGRASPRRRRSRSRPPAAAPSRRSSCRPTATGPRRCPALDVEARRLAGADRFALRVRYYRPSPSTNWSRSSPSPS